MDSTEAPARRPLHSVKGGAVWGALALAMAAGCLTVRYQPRLGTWLALGCAALGCWKHRRPARPPAGGVESPSGTAPSAAAAAPLALPPPLSVGNLLLQVEPLPSVVEDETRGVIADGEAGRLLDQEPLLAFEEPLLLEMASIWPGAGAEIPDAVELPELHDS